MSRLPKNIGHLETVTVTYPTITETYNPTGTYLPTSEPTTGQFSYTIQSSDLPTFSDSQVKCQCSAIIIAGGKNNNASSRNVHFRILKNGVSSITSFITVSGNYYWTLNLYTERDIAIGDIFEVRLWCTTAANDIDWKYNTYFVRPTRLFFGSNSEVFINFSCPEYSMLSLTGGVSPAVHITAKEGVSSSLYNHGNESTNSINVLNLTNTAKVVMQDETYGLCKIHYGDYLISYSGGNSATYMPYYIGCYNHTNFQFRRMKL